MSESVEQCRAARGSVVVLLVEDDPHVRMLMRLVLETEGFQVVVAIDGAEALRVLRRMRPRIVLLDLDLPLICGEQVAAEVRDIHGSAVRVIVVRAASDGCIRAYRADADGYLAKPFDVDTLVKRVSEAVGV
jgi:DNA-binding response OmpR family regulator